MAPLTTLMTRFCAGEDSWLARSTNTANGVGPTEAKNSTGKLRRNRHKRRSNGDNTDDTTVNAGFSGSKSGDTQDDVDGDAGLSKDDDDDMENVQQDTDDDEHAEVRAGGNKDKDATYVPPPEKVKEHTAARGEGVLPSRRGRAPEDVGQGSPGKRSRTDPVAAKRRFDF